MTLSTAPVISPVRHHAVIFDLDGVVTDTASVHAAAWRRLFDDFLGSLPGSPGEDHRPFTDEDYLAYVDGRSRFDGVSALLRSRGVYLPAGNPDDPPDRPTRHGLGNRKDGYFRHMLATDGVRVFPGTVSLIRQLRHHGIALAVVSASRNCGAVLAAAGLADLFAVRVDGVLADRLRLPGKPDPALFLEAASRLGVPPGKAVVVEDARAGVLAGHRGGFGLVIGVDRAGDPAALRAAGADVVVSDLSEVTVSAAEPLGSNRSEGSDGSGSDQSGSDQSGSDQLGSGQAGDSAGVTGAGGATGSRAGSRLSSLPDAEAVWKRQIAPLLAGRRIAVFCDFDGTLSPIVDHPDAAFMPAGTRGVLARLARYCPVAVISGRDLTDVRARVGLSDLWYAGGHGVELAGPYGEQDVVPAAAQARPVLATAGAELADRLGGVPGVFLEPKHYTLSVHYRAVAPERVAEVVDTVGEVAAHHPELVVLSGRRVAELQPDIDWDKGQALRWLLDRFDPADDTGERRPGRLLPIYAGDDITDEFALAEIRDEGLGIVVRSDEHGDRPTAAYAAVSGPPALCRFLGRVADLLEHQASTP